MENEEIIILDEGLEDSPDHPGLFCCATMIAPFNSGWF
jgi:hypothetical protein